MRPQNVRYPASDADSRPRPSPARHRVVIVGGGFGGVYAARALRKAPADITLIDRRNVHVFSPMLYQAATGAVAPADLSQPLRSMFRSQRNVRVLLGDAAGIDVEGRRVLLSDGSDVEYDSLVVAAGMRSTYFGNEGWRAHAPGLKTLEDAAEIRRRVLLAFETAEREPDPDRRRAWMTIVVVGAGPTGVELAGAVAELAHVTLRREFRVIDTRAARVVLVEAQDELLPGWPDPLRQAARRELGQLGVLVRTGTSVADIAADHADLMVGHVLERVDARTAVWAAGVRPGGLGRELATAVGATVDRAGRIVVGPDMSVPGHPEIFVVGDLAAVTDTAGRPVADVAQKSIQTGRYVGARIAARLRRRPARAFRYRDIGDLAMVGRFRTVARLPFGNFAGFLPWLLWLGVHLYYLHGVHVRLLVAIRWLWTMASGARGSRLITGRYSSYGALPPLGGLARSASEPIVASADAVGSPAATAGATRAGHHQTHRDGRRRRPALGLARARSL